MAAALPTPLSCCNNVCTGSGSGGGGSSVVNNYYSSTLLQGAFDAIGSIYDPPPNPEIPWLFVRTDTGVIQTWNVTTQAWI